MELANPKGMQDYSPEQQILRNQIIDTLKKVFEQYGYVPLDTPALEKLEVLSSKYAGGAGILKEIFKLEDQGGRKLGLRYDLTVPLCRFIALNPNVKLPFKRYQIEKVWRDGPIALGRYREFTQCDIDVIGCKTMAADMEILYLIDSAFKELGLECIIKISNRKLLNGILEYADISKANSEQVILAIDKLDKLGKNEVVKELEALGITIGQIENIFNILEIKGSNQSIIEKMRKLEFNEQGIIGLNEIEELLNLSKNLLNIKLDLSLARGLAYYTGNVFETYLSDSKIKTSVCSGGRYDKIIPQFLGTEKDIPAVGVSFGLDRIYDALSTNEKTKKTKTIVYIIPIKTFEQSFEIAEKLRKAEINAEIDLMGKGISKNLEYANTLKIPYVLFIGEDELKQNKVKLRNMESGKEEFCTVKELIYKLK